MVVTLAEHFRRCATTAVACMLVLMSYAHAPQWQPRRGDWRERVTGIVELEQALFAILETPVGAVPGRPDFGSRLHELVDAPLADLRVFVPREVTRVVKLFESRIKIVGVVVEATAAGHFNAVIKWEPTASSGLLGAGARTTEVAI